MDRYSRVDVIHGSDRPDCNVYPNDALGEVELGRVDVSKEGRVLEISARNQCTLLLHCSEKFGQLLFESKASSGTVEGSDEIVRDVFHAPYGSVGDSRDTDLFLCGCDSFDRDYSSFSVKVDRENSGLEKFHDLRRIVSPLWRDPDVLR